MGCERHSEADNDPQLADAYAEGSAEPRASQGEAGSRVTFAIWFSPSNLGFWKGECLLFGRISCVYVFFSDRECVCACMCAEEREGWRGLEGGDWNKILALSPNLKHIPICASCWW